MKRQRCVWHSCGTPMLFQTDVHMKKKISIIGMGYLGSSLGLALKKNVPESVITGIDKGSQLIRAENVGAIDNGCIYTELETGLMDASLVFMTTPINTTLELIPKIACGVGENTIVSDTAFTKRQIMDAVEKNFTGKAVFIGGHPIVEFQKGEIEEADPYIFSGKNYALIPQEGCTPDAVKLLADLVEKIGSHVVLSTPEEHDELFGGINHMLQLIAMAHVRTVFSPLDEQKRMIASALCEDRFKSLIQELFTPYYVWDEILSSNRDPVMEQIERFIHELQRIVKLIATKEFAGEYEKVQQFLSDITMEKKGFRGELFHLYITMRDEPGSIAKLVSLLAGSGYDIRDIELVKIKEGEAGTVRISFGTQNTASKAGRFLVKSGYSCRTQFEYRDFYY